MAKKTSKWLPRMTRTSRHIFDGRGRDGFVYVGSAPRSPQGRTFIRRLSYFTTPKRAYDQADLARTIELALSQRVVFFCDTSLFDDVTSPDVWRALLGGKGGLVLVPPVLDELAPWMGQHGDHDAAKAIMARSGAIRFFDYASLIGPFARALEYYVNLLLFRKRPLTLAVLAFRKDHRREPTEKELRDIRNDIHRQLGPRGYLLATKGDAAKDSPNRRTDEILTVLAVLTGIQEGKEVVLLTKDEDIQEQFYKLTWILDTHYRGTLLAEAYFRDPLSFATKPIPQGIPVIEQVFESDQNLLIPRDDRLLSSILPRRPSFVFLHCWIIGAMCTQMSFCAEGQMNTLLAIKGRTGGLNTDRLDGRNCHTWLAPLQLSEDIRGYAAIAHDRTLQDRGLKFPLLDILQTVNTVEQYKIAIETPLA